MSACGDKELLLHGLLDGELDAVNTVACERHLQECSGCAAEFERLQALRSRLRAPGVRFEASPELRERIVKGLRKAQMEDAAAGAPDADSRAEAGASNDAGQGVSADAGAPSDVRQGVSSAEARVVPIGRGVSSSSTGARPPRTFCRTCGPRDPCGPPAS